MRIALGLGLVLSTLVTAAACGGEDEHAPALGFTGGGKGSGGSSSRGGSVGEGGEGGEGLPPQDPRAPVVVVTDPDAVEDPDEGEVLTSGEVTVTCSVTQSTEPGSEPVDPATVKIQLLDSEGNVVAE